jgi:predicted  nucleic acid-binding Zn-ribbon protein
VILNFNPVDDEIMIEIWTVLPTPPLRTLISLEPLLKSRTESMEKSIQIPERISSLKSPTTSPTKVIERLQISSEAVKDPESLRKRERELDEQIKRASKKLKPQGSFSVEYVCSHDYIHKTYII